MNRDKSHSYQILQRFYKTPKKPLWRRYDVTWLWRHLVFKVAHFVELNPIWHGGAWWPPKMFLTTVPKRFGGGSWNLVTFNINLWDIKKSYFWFPRLSKVTMATSLSGGTWDFLKLSFHMFPYEENLKVFKSKIWVDIWRKHLKIPLNTKFQQNQSGGLGVTSIWNLGLCIG